MKRSIEGKAKGDEAESKPLQRKRWQSEDDSRSSITLTKRLYEEGGWR